MYLPQFRLAALLYLLSCACATTTTVCPKPAAPPPPTPSATKASNAKTKDVTTTAKGGEQKMVKSYLHLRVPLFNEMFNSTPIASVVGEPITVGQVVDTLAKSGRHGTSANNDAGKKQYDKILNRLIDTRLMLAEARATGIDELPEVKTAIQSLKNRALRQMVELKATKGLKPDPKMVKSLTDMMVREWKIKSIIFDKIESAKAMVAKVKKGADFNKLAKDLVDTKKAKGGIEGKFLDAKKLLSVVYFTVRKLDVGDVAGPVKVNKGFVVLRVEALRHPENAKAKARATDQVITAQRRQVLTDFYAKLIKKLAKKKTRLIKRLNLGAKKPGYEALLKDKRVLVKVDGKEPITIADLALEIATKYFHGVKPAIRDKKINAQKEPALKALLYKKVALRHAELSGIAHTQEFKDYVEKRTVSLLVGLFIKRVVASGLKLSKDEAKSYFKKNIAKYSYPEFFKLRSLGFTDITTAKEAIASLRKGTDFKWVESHTENLAPPTKRTATQERMTLSAKGLEPALVDTLAGAKVGDYRLYASPDGYFYAVQMKAHILPRPRKFDDVSKGIIKKLRADKVNEALKDWISKLRKAYDVKIYVQNPEA
jgi:parvulin-like peptidyl-prolyl isomerase